MSVKIDRSRQAAYDFELMKALIGHCRKRLTQTVLPEWVGRWSDWYKSRTQLLSPSMGGKVFNPPYYSIYYIPATYLACSHYDSVLMYTDMVGIVKFLSSVTDHYRPILLIHTEKVLMLWNRIATVNHVNCFHEIDCYVFLTKIDELKQQCCLYYY